jgi:diguanylate cyclase (GGDEF)-like protein
MTTPLGPPRDALDLQTTGRSLELMLESVPRSISLVDRGLRTLWSNPQSLDLRPLPADVLVRIGRRDLPDGADVAIEVNLRHDDVSVTLLPVAQGVLVVAERDRTLSTLADFAVQRLISETLQSREPLEVIRSALSIARETIGWRWAAVTEFVEPIGEVEVLAFVDGEQRLPEGWRYDLIGTPCHHVVRSGDAVFIDRMQERFRDEPALVELGAQVYVGMVYRALGRPVGHVFFMHDRDIDGRRRAEAETLVRVFSAFLGPRLELLRAYRDLDEARDEARIDALTGLGNRRAFDAATSRVRGLIQRGALKDATLCVFDLDGLKRINDRDGHAAGDRLLVVAARLIEQSSRRDDLLFRLGGDEFAMIVSSDAERFRRCWDERLDVLGRRLSETHPGAGISAGFARMVESGNDPDAWLRLADSRMYAEKQARAALAS